MAVNIEHGKWYDSHNTDPQNQGSIYFLTKNSTKYAGTYIGYSQYKSLDEQIFQDGEISKWIIRDRKIQKVKEEHINYRGIEFCVKAKEDIGFYWQASFRKDNEKVYVNRESKEQAISSIKKRIDG